MITIYQILSNTTVGSEVIDTYSKKFTVYVIDSKNTGVILLKKSFNDFNDAMRFFDDVDMWYGDKYEIKFDSRVKNDCH